jgi:hypothetical protein
MCSIAVAGGMFGPPQTLSKKEGGLNTAIGYQYVQDTLKNDLEHVFRQHQIYSHAAWGASNLWEIYGRVGISDLKISDAFASSNTLTAVSKTDFEENWKFFGTLGGKIFYPFDDHLGVGAFIQWTYHFSNYTDDVVGVYHATPFAADLKIKNLWDVKAGLALQAAVVWNIKIYGGPFVDYTQADARLPAPIPGLLMGGRDDVLRNTSKVGGFLGVDMPLLRGFRLNIESRYTDQFSIGSAVTYTY